MPLQHPPLLRPGQVGMRRQTEALAGGRACLCVESVPHAKHGGLKKRFCFACALGGSVVVFQWPFFPRISAECCLLQRDCLSTCNPDDESAEVSWRYCATTPSTSVCLHVCSCVCVFAPQPCRRQPTLFGKHNDASVRETHRGQGTKLPGWDSRIFLCCARSRFRG